MAVSAATLCAMVGLCSFPATSPPPEEAACLTRAYPEHICDVRANLVFWCDGEVMLYDSMKTYEDHDDLLNNADIQDQLVQRYPIGRGYPIPLPVDFEPGRIRSQPFFLKMYGANARAVDSTLARVHWMPKSGGKKLKVTSVNEVDKRLAAVSRELESMPEESRRFVEETSGTFVWRRIKGTDRLSMHSFAIAVDVGVRYSDYWRWNNPLADGSIPYKNRMPLDVVEVFEKHGFIWGGKWYHFDTMHFEYRPELLECGVGPVAHTEADADTDTDVDR